MTKIEVEKLVKTRLSRWRELTKKHFPAKGDLTLVVLKGHLIIEQQLTALICHYCPSPDYVTEARLTFRQKLALARALVFIPIPDRLWDALAALNSIRNDLAHNLEAPKLEKHVAEAKAILQELRSMNKALSSHQNPESDIDVIRFLVAFAEGYFEAADSAIAVIETQRRHA